jgi:class 3 adenylate cyclase
MSRRTYQSVLIGMAVIMGACCTDAVQKMVFSLEMDSLTIRQKWTLPSNRSQIAPISLVSIDSHTMATDPYMRYFNTLFSRKAAGYAVRFFKRTQPRSVIFDTSFNGGIHYQDLAGDQSLVDSLQGSTEVSSTLGFELKESRENDFNAYAPTLQKLLLKQTVDVAGLENFPVLQRNYSFDSLIPPYAQLLESPMQFFSANASIYKANLDNRADDTQGLSRRWAALSFYGGHAYPTIALGVVLNGVKKLSLSPNGELTWGQGKLDLGIEGVPLIKWYGHGTDIRKSVYPEFSFGDVVLSEIGLECRENPSQAICAQIALPKQPKLLPEQFKNRHVLIGFVLPNSGDEHATIYSPKYPGVYIVANTLDNALNNNFVKPAPLWLNILCGLLLPALLLVVLWRFKSAASGLLILITLALGQFLLGLYAYTEWNLWVYVVPPILAMLLCFSGSYIYRYTKEIKRREQLRFAFGKYVAPSVLEIIEKHPEKLVLGGERREMTYLFSDIRAFTAFSDRNPPEVVQTFLSQYFSTMNKIILQGYHGSINKLMGDAIMAYWGFPLENEDHAFLAVSAAMAMRDAMLEWSKNAESLPITIGIGINTGECMVGNIGSEDFMDFTVIGDAVNIASRLEGVNKQYGSTIIISSDTYERVKDRISARRLGWADLKGKVAQVEIFEPLGFL